jgi:hypothetical protein
MLVNRDNWYQSPINEWGRTRPDLFNAFQQITELYFALDPTTLDKTTRIAVSFDPLQRGTERPGQDLLQSFYQADIDYDFFDLSRGATTHSIAFYAGGRWLSREGQAWLVDYVESGGHLVCIGAYPHMDEHLQPLNLLNIHAPEGIMSAAPMRMRLSLFEDEVESAWVYNYDSTPGDAITVKRLPVQQLASEELRLQFDVQAGAPYMAGYTQTRGQGRLTVLGIKPSPGLLLAVLNHFGAVIPSRSRTPDVSTGLYRRDGDFYLLAANIGAEAKSAQVALEPEIIKPGQWTLQNLDSGEAHSADITTAGTLTINIPRKDGAVFRLSRGSL